MAAPEAVVKAKVRRLLNEYGDELYSYWPVPSGFGRTTIDCLGCYRGRFFSIEAKAPGRKPTLRQVDTLAQMERAMGKTFVIDSVSSPVLADLRTWLDQLKETIDDCSHITPDPVSRRTI